MKDDADWSLEDEVVERGLTEFSDRHGVAREDLDALRARIERFEIETHGLVDAPRLFEMVESGVDGKDAVRWLLECDLERESALLSAWEVLACSTSRRTSLADLPALCEKGAAYLEARKIALVSKGASDGASSWLESELSRCWRHGLFRLREDDHHGGQDPVLFPQDGSLVPEARALMGDLRARVLLEAELAITGKAPASFWGRVLNSIPTAASGAFFALAARLDIALEGQVPDEPVGGLADLVRLAIHFESELLFGDWSDADEGLREIDTVKGYYALRMSTTWAALEPTLVEWMSNASRRRAFCESRERAMRRSLRSIIRVRDARLLWRSAAGNADADIPEQLGRWHLPAVAADRLRRHSVRSDAVTAPLVVTLGPDDCFMIGGTPLTYESSGRRLGVRPTNALGALLRHIVEHGECRKEGVHSRDRSLIAKAIRTATKGDREGMVDLARGTSKPTRRLEFDDETRRKLMKFSRR